MVKRRAMQIFFVLGLVLTLATGTLWVRGFWTADSWSIGRGEIDDVFVWKRLGIHTDSTVMLVSFHRRQFPEDQPHPEQTGITFSHQSETSRPFSFIAWPDESLPFWNRVGFHYESAADDVGLSRWDGGVPSWFVVLLCLVTTIISSRYVTREHRSRSRLARGLCLACGYELRGAAHERCPECGSLVSPASHDDPSSLSKMK